MFAYGYDALLKYQAIQRGEIAQGNIAVHKQTTTSTASYWLNLRVFFLLIYTVHHYLPYFITNINI